MSSNEQTRQTIRSLVNIDRLVQTAKELIAVPSPTGNAGAAADRLEQILADEGFAVDRIEAGHPNAPAVIVRLNSGRPGRTLQFDGHLDTVHLPFVPPGVDGDNLTGSGSCDMKGGLVAAVEAVRVLRDSQLLTHGSILLTAHDLHEAPWGNGAQLDELIRQGIVGDAVLIPEPLTDHLPVAGRGAATWKITIRRPGPPCHEVARPEGEPNVIDAGMKVVQALFGLNLSLGKKTDPVAGTESIFIGQIHSGEIYNQFPQECWLEGTRRWLPSNDRDKVREEFLRLLDGLKRMTRTSIETDYRHIRDAYRLDLEHPLVECFQSACEAVRGAPLETGPKAFVDDGNSFWGLAGVPAITHGPKAGGQHTVSEWVSISDLARIAEIYALTAITYCSQSMENDRA